MPRGGARNRSGPKPQEGSARSDARGYSLEALPPTGRKGRAPKFPLPDPSERELQVWREVWRTPQAVAWEMPENKWRIPTVALWVRTRVRCEDPEVGAAVIAQLHRLADQIGMTTAGLAEMGWKIAPAGSSDVQGDVRSRPAKAGGARLRALNGGLTA